MTSLPPGPKGTVVQTIRFFLDNLGMVQASARQYGDPFTLPLAGDRMVMTADPEGIREIFSADPDILDSAAAPLELLTGKNALVAMSGAAHRRARKLLSPPLHGSRMRVYDSLIRDITLHHASAWKRGERMNLFERIREISMDVIIRAVFGVAEGPRRRQFRELVAATIDTFRPVFLYAPVFRAELHGLGPWSRYRRAVEAMIGMLKDEIRSRRASPGAGDILSLLLSVRDDDGVPMTEGEIIDQLRGLLIGGHETSAITLSWAFYEVLRHPRVRDKLLDELASLGPDPAAEQVVKLPYLTAVCEETLRLHPVAAAGSRRLNRPWKLKGWDLPAGVMVCFAMGVTHFDERIYSRPRSFEPERFLERSYSPFEYMPFGGGAHRCLGAAFALHEMQIVLGTLLAHHELALASDRALKTILYGVPLGPEGGVPTIYLGPRRSVRIPTPAGPGAPMRTA
jgi:cytochrome P450 family 110